MKVSELIRFLQNYKSDLEVRIQYKYDFPNSRDINYIFLNEESIGDGTSELQIILQNT